MHKKILFSLAFFLAAFADREALCAADFYGVKMMSEYYAKDLTFDESQDTPRFAALKPGMDGRIYATATLSGRNLKIEVFNRSDETIRSDSDYTEYVVVTHDGERHFLKLQPMAWASSDTIAPNKSATFEPSFEGRALKKSEIRAVICSFDLGDMKIILLPLSKKFEAAAPKAAAKPAPPVKPESKELPKAAPKKVEDKKSFFGNLFGPKRETQPAPKSTLSEVKKTEPKKAEPPKLKKETTFSPENEKKLLDQYEKSKKSRKYWRVEEVRDSYLVINLGAGDGLKPGASVQIARDGAFLVEATIRQSSQGYSTVSIPQEAAAGVKAGDDVLFFDATI